MILRVVDSFVIDDVINDLIFFSLIYFDQFLLNWLRFCVLCCAFYLFICFCLFVYRFCVNCLNNYNLIFEFSILIFFRSFWFSFERYFCDFWFDYLFLLVNFFAFSRAIWHTYNFVIFEIDDDFLRVFKTIHKFSKIFVRR